MFNVKAFAGEREILASGNILSRVSETIELRPLPSPSESYTVACYFNTSTENTGTPSISWKIENQARFGVTFTNFSQVLWTATQEPVYVANHAGRKVLMHLASLLIGAHDTGTRLVAYSFLDGGTAGG